MTEYKGLAYPIEKTVHGYFRSGDNLAQVKASMLTIIMTRPGERVMRSKFGTPLHRLKGRPRELIPSEARQMIALAIKIWEPRVQVTEITTYLVDDGVLSIQIDFLDPNTSLKQIQRMSLQLQLLD